VRAAVLGTARAGDPHLLSPGLIATARGPGVRSLSIGLSAPVTLKASAPIKGVLVPREALLRSGGETWIYVRTAGDTFLRKEVENGRRDASGLFAPEGLKPGEQVVTRGAIALFAAETNVPDEADAKGGDDKSDEGKAGSREKD
jgi:multidrug efflux pump subunit AcrA (membrane-fusion protein)